MPCASEWNQLPTGEARLTDNVRGPEQRPRPSGNLVESVQHDLARTGSKGRLDVAKSDPDGPVLELSRECQRGAHLKTASAIGVWVGLRLDEAVDRRADSS